MKPSRLIAVLSLTTLGACSWISGATNWANCNMPTMSGTRKDCKDESSMANAPRNAPPGNAAAPAANYGYPPPMPADPRLTPGMAEPMGTHPHSFGQPKSVPYNPAQPGQMQPAQIMPAGTSYPPAPSIPVDDFPAEYRNVKPARSYEDPQIPLPPI